MALLTYAILKRDTVAKRQPTSGDAEKSVPSTTLAKVYDRRHRSPEAVVLGVLIPTYST
jgi:hypothetical protein